MQTIVTHCTELNVKFWSENWMFIIIIFLIKHLITFVFIYNLFICIYLFI